MSSSERRSRLPGEAGRFIENHDEPRAAAAFPEEAAALTSATIPGARLFYEGQFEGCTVRTPIFLGRRAEERPNEELRNFYERLLEAVDGALLHEGEWKLCHCTGWPDNPSFRNLMACCWEQGEDRAIGVVNLGGAPAQSLVHLPWKDLQGRAWRLDDRLSDTVHDRDGVEMSEQGFMWASNPGSAICSDAPVRSRARRFRPGDVDGQRLVAKRDSAKCRGN